MRKFLLCLLIAAPAFAADPTHDSGLPIPRFVSLKSEEINVRTGPGTRYPIAWVYKKEGLPVEIVEEFEHWRRLRDKDGSKGWVHKSMLSGTRTALVTAKSPQVLRADPESDAPGILKLSPGVQVKLSKCKKDWCRANVDSQKGWIEKKNLWGVYPSEQFD